MRFKDWLKLALTDEVFDEDLLIYCKKCFKVTPHSEHGFRRHNYRLCCKICNEVSYSEYD